MNLLDRFGTVFFRTYTYRILDNFLELALDLLPFLLAGIVVVAALQRFVPRLTRIPLLRTDTLAAVLAATFAGMAAPLPVYLAVPFSAVLLAAGMSLRVVVAFLVACPLIDPNLFLLTWGAFGPAMAVARAVSAFLLGAGAGLICTRHPAGWLTAKLSALTPDTHKIGRPFRTALWRQNLFIIRIFSISLLIGASIKALAPPELVRSLFAGGGYSAILIAIGLGVPFYQCGGASIPVMEALYQLGLPAGAVLAFFISGPATKISAVYAFQAGFGARSVALYVAYTAAGAFVAGVVFSMLI